MNHDLIYRLSHDLQAPLRGISLSAGWILEGLGEHVDEDMESAAAALGHSVSRMSRLLSGLLDVSRADRGENVDPGGGPFTVLEVVESAALDFPDVEVVVSGDEELSGGRAGFDRTVRELLSNAALHGEASPTRVTVTVERACVQAVITLSDEGRGVDPRMGPDLFELFASRFGASSSEHVGVGLAVARATAEANGGELQLVQGEHSGACFRLTWPVSVRRRLCA